MAASGTDPAALAAITVIAFGGGVFLVAFRRPAIKWVNTHARRSFGDVLGVAALVLGYTAFAVYYAVQGNGLAIILLVAAILGALSVPAFGLLVPKRKPSRRSVSTWRSNEPASPEYIRLLFGGLLLLTAVLGLLLLLLVELNINPLVALASVVVVGTIPISALTIAGSIDLRQRGALTDAGAAEIIKAGLLIPSRLISFLSDLFRKSRD